MAVVRDITRLHQLEAEVRRGETLAAAGQMAVGLAHEIRNPLGAIRGAVQLMQRELGDEARCGEYTDVLLKEVDRVNRIIEMLLDLGRPVTLRPVPLNVHQLLERVALLSEEMAARARRADRPALRPEPAADPGRRGPHPAGLPQPRAQRDRGHAGGRAPHAGHAAQHEPALRQGGPGARASAAWPRSRWSTRAQGIPEATRAQALHPVLHHQGQGPRPRAWPSATASSRSIAARSRSTSEPRARHRRLLLPARSPDRAIRAMPRRTHPDRRRRGQPALGPREGLPRRRLPGHRGQGRHRRPPGGRGASPSTSSSSTSACPASTASPLLEPGARAARPTRRS